MCPPRNGHFSHSHACKDSLTSATSRRSLVITCWPQAAHAHLPCSLHPYEALMMDQPSSIACACPKGLYPQQCLGLKMWPQGVAHP